MKLFSKQKIIIIVIFIFALSLRILGLNWDDNNHLHPDERFLTMVTTDIKLPTSIYQYLDTSSSPLNPYNYPSYQFFVYGTFPIFLVKFLAVILHLDDYNNITLLGRVISALFDSGNIILLYFIAKKILKSFYVYLPSIFYALLVLPLQLSHFFTVDTFYLFFILATFTLFAYQKFLLAFISFALALACKLSGLYFLPLILLFIIYFHLSIFKSSFYFLLSFLCFRFFQPYAFLNIITPNPLFIGNLKTLSSFSNPNIFFPPSVQWLNRLPLLDSFTNLTLWGLGLAFSLPFLILLIRYILKFKLKFNLVFIISFWVLILFIFQGSQFIHAMRYLFPIYPFLCLLFVALLFRFKIKKSTIILIIICQSLYAFSFLSIYLRPHSRVDASNWLNQNIPSDKIISSEYWDDALPLGFSKYQSLSLPFYDPDNFEKWVKINQSLNSLDYLIMSSNRLWGSIPRVPDQYPQSSQFYNNLFSGNSDFILFKKFTSYPGLPLSFLKSCYYFGPSIYPGIKNYWFETDINCQYPGIYLRDDTAEEAFTVYDHPQVLIFSKQKLN